MTLLSCGLTNPQIADRLGISLAGARYHVSEILAKLEVGTRDEAIATWQATQGDRRRLSWLAALRVIPAAVRAAGLALASASLAVVLALAIGHSGRFGEEDRTARNASTPPAVETLQIVLPDADLVAFRGFAVEATEAARTASPTLLLLQVNINLQVGTPTPRGNAGPYSFRFTDPTRTLEIYVTGPDAATGTPRWRVDTVPSVNGPNTTTALDIGRLQASPGRVVAALRSGVPAGTVLFGLTLYTQDVDLLWAAFGSRPDGIIRCDVADATGLLQVDCPYPPSQPPRVAPATP